MCKYKNKTKGGFYSTVTTEHQTLSLPFSHLLNQSVGFFFFFFWEWQVVEGSGSSGAVAVSPDYEQDRDLNAIMIC